MAVSGIFERVPVALEARGYEVMVGDGLLMAAHDHLPDLARYSAVFLIADAAVEKSCGSPLLEQLEQRGVKTHALIVPSGENSKRFEQLETLLETMLAQQPDRKCCLIALGGGVVGDLVGLAASLLLRGVDFIQIPTTLLAMVDSSVGGKTAINSRHGKNLIGAFYQPKAVLADTDLLATLPRREWLSGYAEVAKYGALGDAEFFGWLESQAQVALAGDRPSLQKMIAHCVRIKATIVAEDEREGGRRALLNLGHTLGHALEAETGYGSALLHGEAVALGMVFAFRLANHLDMCPAADTARLETHLAQVGLPIHPHTIRKAWDQERLLQHCFADKKAEHQRLTFVLPRNLGRCEVVKAVPADAVREVLADWLKG